MMMTKGLNTSQPIMSSMEYKGLMEVNKVHACSCKAEHHLPTQHLKADGLGPNFMECLIGPASHNFSSLSVTQTHTQDMDGHLWMPVHGPAALPQVPAFSRQQSTVASALLASSTTHQQSSSIHAQYCVGKREVISLYEWCKRSAPPSLRMSPPGLLITGALPCRACQHLCHSIKPWMGCWWRCFKSKTCRQPHQ